MRIYLVGYMASGKSKISDALSKLLLIPFVDTDTLIEMQVGRTIENIFETSGQEFFRKLENLVLLETAKSENIIVSTGGGLPSFNANMDWMNANGITIYLEANAGLLFHRLATSRGNRPLLKNLTDIELMEQITGHLAERIPIYKKAKIIVSAANLNAKTLADKILKFKNT